MDNLWDNNKELIESIASAVANIYQISYDNSIDVQDTKQESLIFIWKHIEAFSPERGPLKNWIYALARIGAINYLKYCSAVKRNPRQKGGKLLSLHNHAVAGKELNFIDIMSSPFFERVYEPGVFEYFPVYEILSCYEIEILKKIIYGEFKYEDKQQENARTRIKNKLVKYYARHPSIIDAEVSLEARKEKIKRENVYREKKKEGELNITYKI